MWTACVVALIVFVVAAPRPRAADRSSGDPPNAIQIENAKPGTSEWILDSPGLTSGIIEGYASLTSVNRGDRIALFVNTAEPSYTMDIFRMGYYGGLGGRRMMDTITRMGTSQPPPTRDPVTGLAECQWVDPYVLTIPNTPDPTDWMSGIYLVKLTAGVTGTQQYIIFAVRDDDRPTDLLLAQTVNTYQAYNPWGGTSLYGTIRGRADTAHKANKVSFDRPYYGEDSNGAAAFFSWEFPMLQWLEQQGYDVSYATNVDVDASATLVLSHRAFLSVGHDEYWTWSMRDHVEAARDGGVNLGFFSGNVSYWQVRYEPSVSTGADRRTLVGYKEFWEDDPITPDYLKTNEFRFAPVNRPEDAMIGVSYITVANLPLVVEDASHWIFTGTGLNDGDSITYPDGSPILGYEVDVMGAESPSTLRRLAHSPVPGAPGIFADTTIYTAPSGATVFASGSISWPVSVPAIAQMTQNVLSRFLTGAFSDPPAVRAAPPSAFLALDIGDVGRSGFVALAGDRSFTIDGAGQDDFAGNDALYFVYQALLGDGQITARLTSLEQFWDNRAGVMIRESLAPEARYASLVARPSGSVGAVNEGVEFVIKNQDAGDRTWVDAADLAQPNWLRVSRQGDLFRAFTSEDGSNWVSLGSATIPMASAVYIGAEVASARHNVWASASFDHVIVDTAISAPTDCTTLALDQTGIDVGAASSDWSLAVTAPGACTWLIASDAPWLTVAGPNRIAIGSASLAAHADANAGGARTGHLTLGPVVYTVTQDSVVPSSCAVVTLDQTSFFSGAVASNWVVNITAPDPQCEWTVLTDAPWLTVTPLSAAAGNGSILVHTDDSAGAFRVAHFTIAGATYTVEQEGAPGGPTACASVSLSRTTFYSGAIESDWVVGVTTPDSTCTWSVSSDSAWLVVTTLSVNGDGTGTILVHTDTNAGPFRNASFTIANAPYAVDQEGR